MRKQSMASIGCFLSFAFVLVNVSCALARELQTASRQYTPTPKRDVTLTFPTRMTGPRVTATAGNFTPLKKMPPPTPKPTVTPDLSAWPFATPTCTNNPAGLTLTVTQRPGDIPSPTGEGLVRSFYVEGVGFVPGENVTIYINGYPPIAGNKGSTTATAGADSTFATTVASVMSQARMSLDVFVSHSRGVACITVEAKVRQVLPSATPIDLSKLHVTRITRVDLGCHGAAAIAPDDEHYVCSGGPGKPGLWLGSLGKGLERRLAETGGAPAVWLPNGKAVVYSEIVMDQPTKLYSLDLETGKRVSISNITYPLGGDHLQVLPDGRVIFLEKEMLQAWDSNAGTVKSLQTIGCVDPNSQTPVASYYTAVSPNGERIAEACAGSLYLIDVQARKTITLSDQVGIFVKTMAWSPDGSRVAYSVQPDSDPHAELWLVKADGSRARRIWRDDQARAFEWLTWMPDGHSLLFIKNPGGTSFRPGYTYMAINVDGGPPKELFKNGESLHLFDSGRKILISRSVEDTGDWIVEFTE